MSPQSTEDVPTFGPILKRNEDGSYSAEMAETPFGGWIRLADHQPVAREVRHLRKTCADFGVHPARVPDHD